MSRLLLSFILSVAALAHARAQSINGSVEGRSYVSPTGAFKITIPVMPELGGNISDTEEVVTFQDEFTMHVSIAALPLDATQKWEQSTRERKDFLTYFFGKYVFPDFKRNFKDARIESAKFLADTLGGAIFVQLLLPGGSMFSHRVPIVSDELPPIVAKRGNLLFMRGGRVFIISTELAERSTELGAYKKTTAEEDEILFLRLRDIVSRIQFSAPPDAPAAKK